MKCSFDGCGKKHHAKGYCSTHYRLTAITRNKSIQRKARRGEPMRFLQKICSEPMTDRCILWPFGRDNFGYGSIATKSGSVTASRKVLMMHTGINPEGHHACHGKCHEPLCVNPNHLEWKKPKGNQRDRLRDGTHNRGEKCGTSKVTRVQVTAIRKELASGLSSAKVAKKLSTTINVVRNIKEGKSWNWHIDEYNEQKQVSA